MESERLQHLPAQSSDLDAFHRLLQDEHVRRYLLDGQLVPREWSEERVLEKLGFTRISTQKGHFGNMFLMRLSD